VGEQDHASRQTTTRTNIKAHTTDFDQLRRIERLARDRVLALQRDTGSVRVTRARRNVGLTDTQRARKHGHATHLSLNELEDELLLKERAIVSRNDRLGRCLTGYLGV